MITNKNLDEIEIEIANFGDIPLLVYPKDLKPKGYKPYYETITFRDLMLYVSMLPYSKRFITHAFSGISKDVPSTYNIYIGDQIVICKYNGKKICESIDDDGNINDANTIFYNFSLKLKEIMDSYNAYCSHVPDCRLKYYQFSAFCYNQPLHSEVKLDKDDYFDMLDAEIKDTTIKLERLKKEKELRDHENHKM